MECKIITKIELEKWCKANNLHYHDSSPDLSKLLLSNAAPTEETWIVHNFLHERDIAITYAPQKVGKTHFADVLAQSIAVGKEFNSHFQVVEPRSVIVLNGEMRIGQLQKRKRSAERQLEECKEAGPYCEFVMFGSQENDEVEDLTTKEGQQRFLELVDECNARHPESPAARVFILDSLKTLTNGGDVNPAKWNALFRFLNKLRTEHPWTFLIINHTNKLGEESGTHNKAATVDVRARLTRDAEIVLNADPSYFPEMEEDACRQLAGQLARHFSGDRKDCIWFFFMLTDPRDLPKSAGRPFLLEMCPEDNPPRWKSTELNDSGLLEEHPRPEFVADGFSDAASGSPEALEEATAMPSAKKLTYEQLKKADRKIVVAVLSQEVEIGGCKSRESLGQRIGTDNEGIRYLLRKHSLNDGEIGLPRLRENDGNRAES